MNLDFSAEPLFSWYVVLLAISGVAMIAMGAINNGALSTGWRVFNLLAGVGFAGYAFYLAFVFSSGTYFIFFKAFFLPVAMIVNFIRSLKDRKKPVPQFAPGYGPQGGTPGYGPQFAQGYGQPPAGYPAQPAPAGYAAPPAPAGYIAPPAPAGYGAPPAPPAGYAAPPAPAGYVPQPAPPADQTPVH